MTRFLVSALVRGINAIPDWVFVVATWLMLVLPFVVLALRDAGVRL